jgi:hypothetical protein
MLNVFYIDNMIYNLQKERLYFFLVEITFVAVKDESKLTIGSGG